MTQQQTPAALRRRIEVLEAKLEALEKELDQAKAAAVLACLHESVENKMRVKHAIEVRGGEGGN
jgi:tRNA (Thr-GGU) A37 N-methylase